MDAKFWHQRWNSNEIGFHEGKVNPLLDTHFKTITVTKQSRVFVPLCGKSLDMAWLLSNDYLCVGAELSELAVKQFFEELGIEPIVSMTGAIKRFSSTGIEIYVADIFDLSNEIIGVIDAVYDRAALVALPQAMRSEYARHVINITSNAAQLLITFEYDQNLMQGPPFSISKQEVYRHYQDAYEITPLASVDVIGGLKGICPAKENAWLLTQ